MECNWQLSEDSSVELAPDASRAVAQWPEANLLMLFPIKPEGTSLASHKGEEEPLRGWLPGEEEFLAADQLSLYTERMEKQHDYFVSILIPSSGTNIPDVEVETKSPLGQVGYVKLKWPDGRSDEIYWGCGFAMMIGEQHDFSTDSSLVHLSKDKHGRVTEGCCVNGTYLAPYHEGIKDKPETFSFHIES